MNAPERIDVLAVLGALNLADPAQRPGLTKAREAVRELIGTLRQVRIEATESPQIDADRLASIVGMVDATLRNVGGAP